MNKKFLAMAALALITTGAQAKVKLPHILGDNMILQQNTEANLWGWDKPGTTVEVTTSWSGQKYSAKTGKDGKWAIKVQTPKASYTPLSITFDDGDVSNIEVALPMLLERGMVAEFFITSDFIDQPGMLSSKDVRSLADAGMGIGAHGKSHRFLEDLDQEDLEVELEDSLCSASQPIKEKQTAEVEVDKWVSVENDVTFE